MRKASVGEKAWEQKPPLTQFTILNSVLPQYFIAYPISKADNYQVFLPQLSRFLRLVLHKNLIILLKRFKSILTCERISEGPNIDFFSFGLSSDNTRFLNKINININVARQKPFLWHKSNSFTRFDQPQKIPK